MKILLLFILFLISGPVDCIDVIGFSGGSVIIISDIKWKSSQNKYICKVEQSACKDIIRFNSPSIQVQYKRFMLYENTADNFLVLIRKLKPQDAGTYRFGIEDQRNYTVNLKVRNDSCGVSKIMNAHLGQNITITCKYPAEYEKNTKYVDTLNDEYIIKNIINTEKTTENGRFFISDERSSKVISLNISNVKETDGEFYLFGVWNKVDALGYYSYFTEIQLHVTEAYMTTSAAPMEIPENSCSSVIIISVCVCVTLLLFGGFTLMMFYKLRHNRTQDIIPSCTNQENKQLNPYKSNDSAPVYGNIGMSAV